MKTATLPAAEVFLFHGKNDVGISGIVTRAFRDHGLNVYSAATEFQLGDENEPMIRDALSDSSAMVILLTRSTLNSPYVPLEVGAAMVQEKPIFIVYDGIALSEIPRFLTKYPTISLSNLPDLVMQVRDVNG